MLLRTVVCGWVLWLGASSVLAADFYAAVDGRAEAKGTRDAPWDLESALGGRHSIGAGDTLWVRGGTYRYPVRTRDHMGYRVRLSGAEGAPVVVRGYPGERATIDGGLSIGFYNEPFHDVVIRDLEIMMSETQREITQTGSWPTELAGPKSGVAVQAVNNCKLINLVIQHTSDGIGLWSEAEGGEIYGCISVNNGWKAPDRNHGHALYTQSQTGDRVVENCIFQNPFGDGQYTIHAYGSEKAHVDNLLIQDNIAYGPGSLLVGGGMVCHNNRVRTNLIHGHARVLFHSAPGSEGTQIVGNTFAAVRTLSIVNQTGLVLRDNLVVSRDLNFEMRDCHGTIEEANRYVNVDRGGQWPHGVTVKLTPNKYDANRAHLGVVNWEHVPAVRVPVAPFLVPGDAYEVVRAENFYGEPVAAGTCDGDAITLPMSDEFGAYVLRKVRPASASAPPPRRRGI